MLEIQRDKRKLYLILSASSFCFLLGLFLYIVQPGIVFKFLGFIETSMTTTGIGLMVFFGIMIVFLIRKILDKEPELIIDEYGIWRKGSKTLRDRILWENIESVYLTKKGKYDFIAFSINNKKEILDSEPSSIKRKILAANMEINGSHFLISSVILKYDLTALYELIQQKHKEKIRHKK